MYFSCYTNLLVALSIWAARANSQGMPTGTVSAMISVQSSPSKPQKCSPVCDLMASTIPNSDSSFFVSFCESTGRTDCKVNNMQFDIEIIDAGHHISGFSCTCDTPPSDAQSSQDPTANMTSAGSSSESLVTYSPSVTADSTAAITLEISSTAPPTVGSPLSSSVFSSLLPKPSYSPPAYSSSMSSQPSAGNNPSQTANGTISTTTSTTSPAGKPTTPNVSAMGADTQTEKPKPAAIAGAVIGSLCVLACLGGGALILQRRRQRKINQAYIDSFRACSGIQGYV